MKYFVFTLDDGTVFDKNTISLFNKYNIKGTFFLNSGLDNFTWYLDEFPITRLVLNDHVALYNGHEVGSHTLTHPNLDDMDEYSIEREINEDIVNLNHIFSRHIKSFGTPFDPEDERIISIIRRRTLLRSARLSKIDESFTRPIDSYHYMATTLDVNRALELINNFINNKDAEVFIYAGHSYDFEINNTWDKLEELIKILVNQKDIKVVTLDELTSILFQ